MNTVHVLPSPNRLTRADEGIALVSPSVSVNFCTYKKYAQENISFNEKKTLRETQTLRAGCSKTDSKIFAPPQTPFPGAQNRQYLISWRRSLYTCTYRPSLVKIDARNFELLW